MTPSPNPGSTEFQAWGVAGDKFRQQAVNIPVVHAS